VLQVPWRAMVAMRNGPLDACFGVAFASVNSRRSRKVLFSWCEALNEAV